MEIIGFNRVELVVAEDQIHDAVRQLNEMLGRNLPEPHAIEGVPVLSATDFDGRLAADAGQGKHPASVRR